MIAGAGENLEAVRSSSITSIIIAGLLHQHLSVWEFDKRFDHANNIMISN